MNSFVESVRSLANGLSSSEEAKARYLYCKGYKPLMAALYITKQRAS